MALSAALAATPALAQTPKRGGTLTYMIPADAPPSFDGHRENTFATVHAAAPFYSVLIRGQSGQPVVDDRFRVRSLHRDAEADRRRQDLHLQDPRRRQIPRRLAADRGRRGGELAEDRQSARGRDERARRATFRRWSTRSRRPTRRPWCSSLKFATDGVPAGARRSRSPTSTRRTILDKDPHWYEKNILGSGPFKFVGLRDRPVDQGRAQPRLLPQGPALSRRLHRRSSPPSRRPASTRSAPTAPPSSSAACRPRRATSWSRSSATRSRCRTATGTAATC